MDYVNLGKSGLKVSRLCLGMMTYGSPQWRPWILDESQAQPFVERALAAGINFFDTADVYSLGESERVLGNLLKKLNVKRECVVVATKVFSQMSEEVNDRGLSRKHIMDSIDKSLKRLQMDYVDLYQIHRWDNSTPIEETMDALNDVVRAGKARYIGASSMHAWQFAKAQQVAAAHGWTRFVSMQPEWSLIYREEEREMLPLCRDSGVGIIPWSPLGRGRLARPWGEHTPRIASDAFGATLFAHCEDNDRRVAEALAGVAAARAVPRAQVALAWLLAQPGLTAPIVGASKPGHLDDAVAALAVQLSAEEIATLEAPYLPHAVVGFE